MLADYLEIVTVVEPVDVPRAVPNDADDDHVIAAAVAAHAALIVSGDSDLLSMVSYGGIDILPAAMAVEHIVSSPLKKLESGPFEPVCPAGHTRPAVATHPRINPTA